MQKYNRVTYSIKRMVFRRLKLFILPYSFHMTARQSYNNYLKTTKKLSKFHKHVQKLDKR